MREESGLRCTLYVRVRVYTRLDRVHAPRRSGVGAHTLTRICTQLPSISRSVHCALLHGGSTT